MHLQMHAGSHRHGTACTADMPCFAKVLQPGTQPSWEQPRLMVQNMGAGQPLAAVQSHGRVGNADPDFGNERDGEAGVCRSLPTEMHMIPSATDSQIAKAGIPPISGLARPEPQRRGRHQSGASEGLLPELPG